MSGSGLVDLCVLGISIKILKQRTEDQKPRVRQVFHKFPVPHGGWRWDKFGSYRFTDVQGTDVQGSRVPVSPEPWTSCGGVVTVSCLIFEFVVETEDFFYVFMFVFIVLDIGGCLTYLQGWGPVSLISTRSYVVGGFEKIHYLLSFWFSILFQRLVFLSFSYLNPIWPLFVTRMSGDSVLWDRSLVL